MSEAKASLNHVITINGNAGDTLHLFTSDGWTAADTSTLAGYADPIPTRL